jgi:FlaA1/EpsC-like NDP-sugar epimerase
MRRVIVTGGTGTLGRAICERLIASGDHVTVFSRDETKQHQMKIDYPEVQFILGDVRDYQSVRSALRQADIVIHAAAMKQVPACEYFPGEAIRTNVGGAQNIVQAISEDRLAVECVVGISTDKACHPSCVYGNTKALQEAILVNANASSPGTRFVSVRLGNLIGSRGSVALVFREQVASGGPVTITDPDMTRFWFGVNEAVDVVMTAIAEAKPGEIIIPKIQSTSVDSLARALIGERPIRIQIIGARPGEKKHELLLSTEEALRAVDVAGHIVLASAVAAKNTPSFGRLGEPYTSDACLMTDGALKELLARYDLC